MTKALLLSLFVLLWTGSAQAGLDTSPCSLAGGHSSCHQTEMIIWEIWDWIQIRMALDQPVFEQWTYLHQRIALPLAPFFTTLLVAPLALTLGRKGTSVSVALSIGLVFVWYLLYAVLSPMGKIGAMSPFWAAWSQNLLFATVGLGIWLWLNRGSLQAFRT